MADIKEFVNKALVYGSLVLCSTLPSLVTPRELWIKFLIGTGVFLFEEGIRYGRKVGKYEKEIFPLVEELFLEGLQEERRESIVGLRYGDRPSDWDKLATARSFVAPLAFKLERKIKKMLSRQPWLPSPEMSPIYIGGWRPIREVESILRDTPFIFGILGDKGRVYIPSMDELEEGIRRKPDKVVNWVLCNAEGGRVKNWWLPEYRPDGRLRSDLVIITRAASPQNREIGALVISGTHREGTLGGALLTSQPELVKEFYKLPQLSGYLSAKYQVGLRLYFNQYSPNKPRTLQVTKMELLGGSKI